MASFFKRRSRNPQEFASYDPNGFDKPDLQQQEHNQAEANGVAAFEPPARQQHRYSQQPPPPPPQQQQQQQQQQQPPPQQRENRGGQRPQSQAYYDLENPHSTRPITPTRVQNRRQGGQPAGGGGGGERQSMYGQGQVPPMPGSLPQPGTGSGGQPRWDTGVTEQQRRDYLEAGPRSKRMSRDSLSPAGSQHRSTSPHHHQPSASLAPNPGYAQAREPSPRPASYTSATSPGIGAPGGQNGFSTPNESPRLSNEAQLPNQQYPSQPTTQPLPPHQQQPHQREGGNRSVSGPLPDTQEFGGRGGAAAPNTVSGYQHAHSQSQSYQPLQSQQQKGYQPLQQQQQQQPPPPPQGGQKAEMNGRAQQGPPSKPQSQGPHGATMHDLDRVISLLRSPKFYFEGFLLRRTILNTDGQPPKTGDQSIEWSKFYMQLAGTTLSSWDAREMDKAAKEGRQVAPTYTNVTDASVSLARPPAPPPAPQPPTPFVFVMNSAGSNRTLFCCPDKQSLVSWVTAVRLAGWERARLCEMYTATLMSQRLGNPSDPSPLSGSGPRKMEGMMKIRLPGETEWRELWCILSDGSGGGGAGGGGGRGMSQSPTMGSIAGKEKRNRRSSLLAGLNKLVGGGSKDSDGGLERSGSFRSSSFHENDPGFSSAGGAEAPSAKFYLKKGNKKPFVSLVDVYAAAALYPESKVLVDTSALFKVEGTFLAGSGDEALDQSTPGPGPAGGPTRRRGREGFMLALPDEGGSGAMIGWLLGLMDAFSLYGRPRAISYDPRDPNSPYHAYPIGPAKDRLFVDRELAETMVDPSEDRPREVRRQHTAILVTRMRGGPPAGPPRGEPNQRADRPETMGAIAEGGEEEDEHHPRQHQYQQPPPQPEQEKPVPTLPPLSHDPTPTASLSHAADARREESVPPSRSIENHRNQQTGPPSQDAIIGAQSPLPEELSKPSFLNRTHEPEEPKAGVGKEAAAGVGVALGGDEAYRLYERYQRSQPDLPAQVSAPEPPAPQPAPAAAPPVEAKREEEPVPARPAARQSSTNPDDFSDVLAAIEFANRAESVEAAPVVTVPPPARKAVVEQQHQQSPTAGPRQSLSKEVVGDESYNSDSIEPIRSIGQVGAGGVLSRPPPSKTPSIGTRSPPESGSRVSSPTGAMAQTTVPPPPGAAPPAGGAFPSSFAAGKRAAERVAAAQAAQAADKAAHQRPGRAAPGKGKGKQRGWHSSSEEEEEEAEEEEEEEQPARSTEGGIRTLPTLPQQQPQDGPPVPQRQASYGGVSQVPINASMSKMHLGGEGTIPVTKTSPAPSTKRELPQVLRTEEPASDASAFRPAYNSQGLLGRAAQEKQNRAYQAEQAHLHGEPLLQVETKTAPPPTGLVGAIASHEKDRKREGGVGATLTEREREKRKEREREQAEEAQRQQMMQHQQQMMGMGGGGPGMMPGWGWPSMMYGGGPMSMMGGAHGGGGGQGQGQPQGYEQMMMQQMHMQQAMMAAQQAYFNAMSGFSSPGVSAPVSPQAGPTGSPHLGGGGMPPSMGSGFFGGPGAGFHPMMGSGMPGMMGMGGFGGGGGLQPQQQQHFGGGSMMGGGGSAGPRQRSPGPSGDQARE